MRLLLQLYASDSAELIGRYYWNRCRRARGGARDDLPHLARIKEQRALQAGEYKLGSITVRAQLLRDHLRVEVAPTSTPAPHTLTPKPTPPLPANPTPSAMSTHLTPVPPRPITTMPLLYTPILHMPIPHLL